MSGGTGRQTDAGPFLLWLLPPLKEFRILTQCTLWSVTRAKGDTLHARQLGNSKMKMSMEVPAYSIFFFKIYITGNTDMTLKLKKAFGQLSSLGDVQYALIY